MSGSFTGFSEDYIRKLTNANGEESESQSNIKGNHGIGIAAPKKKDRSEQIKKILKQDEKRLLILNTKLEKCNLPPIVEQAKLLTTSETTTAPLAANIISSGDVNIESSSSVPIDQDSPPPNKRLNLEEAQLRQKLIEEQNKKRKEVLAKVLADKTKKTLAETQKLKQIQTELQRLDSLHSADINILRKQIELASLDYMEAEKRYLRIEKEFLNSKLDLHLKLERKELLAEHLCGIIERNEEGKAKKLIEMLSQLNLNIEMDDNNMKDAAECTGSNS